MQTLVFHNGQLENIRQPYDLCIGKIDRHSSSSLIHWFHGPHMTCSNSTQLVHALNARSIWTEYWLTFENNLERQGRDPVDIKTGIPDWCFTEQSLQSWVECAQMAPGGLSLQARRHAKCLHTASVWASVWKRVCQEPHHHNRWTAAERLRVPYSPVRTHAGPKKKTWCNFSSRSEWKRYWTRGHNCRTTRILQK